MPVSSDILNLTLPRYVPFVVKGTSLAVWYDSQEDQYLVLCPECRELITCDTIGIVYQEMVWSKRKRCQGCRAKIKFQQNPSLIGLFPDYWQRTGNFPESATWLGAIPSEQFNLWAKAIRERPGGGPGEKGGPDNKPSPSSLAGCGKTPILRHSGESQSPGGLEKTGFLLPQE